MTLVVGPNVKLWSDVILVLPSVTIELSIVRKKKKRIPPNVTKVRLELMLVLHNIIMELSNLRIKNRVPLHVTKIELDAMLALLNMTMESSNLRKNKGTTICNRRTVKFDIGIA